MQVEVEPIIVRFFGIFFLFFQSSSVWGNLISSLGEYLAIKLNNVHIYIDIIPYHKSLYSRNLRFNKFNSIPLIIVLKSDSDEEIEPTDPGKCGTNYCPWTNVSSENFGIDDDKTLYTLAGIYLACSVLAWILVIIFLDPLSR